MVSVLFYYLLFVNTFTQKQRASYSGCAKHHVLTTYYVLGSLFFFALAKYVHTTFIITRRIFNRAEGHFSKGTWLLVSTSWYVICRVCLGTYLPVYHSLLFQMHKIHIDPHGHISKIFENRSSNVQQIPTDFVIDKNN